MTFIPNLLGVVDNNNSSTTPLAGDVTYTGTGTEVTDYASMTVFVVSDVISAPNGVEIDFSSDNVNWSTVYVGTLIANKPFVSGYAITGRYARVKYTNSPIAQSTFRLQTILHTTKTANTGIIIDSSTSVNVSNKDAIIPGL